MRENNLTIEEGTNHLLPQRKMIHSLWKILLKQVSTEISQKNQPVAVNPSKSLVDWTYLKLMARQYLLTRGKEKVTGQNIATYGLPNPSHTSNLGITGKQHSRLPITSPGRFHSMLTRNLAPGSTAHTQ